MKNNIWWVIALLGICLTNCSRKQSQDILFRAEVSLWDHLDSVPFYLNQLQEPSTLPEKEQAHYYLIHSFYVRYMNGGTYPDSLIRISENYFRSAGDTLHLGSSLFQKVWIYQRAGKVDSLQKLYDEILFYSFAQRDSSRISQAYWEMANLMKEHVPEDTLVTWMDRTVVYATDRQRPYVFMGLGDFYRKRNDLVRAEFYYREAADFSYRKEKRKSYLRACDKLMVLYTSQQKYKKAFIQLDSFRKAMRWRLDNPYTILAKANIWHSIHESDSALYYYQMAARSSQAHVSATAQHQLAQLLAEQGDYRRAYGALKNSYLAEDDEMQEMYMQQMEKQHRESLLQSELKQVKAEKKYRELAYVLLLLILILVVFVGYFFYFQMKKQQEAMLARKQSDLLEKENQLLKQHQELSVLREKEILLREELFRKMAVWHKLPSLHHREGATTDRDEKRIMLSEADWHELIEIIDNGYSCFTARLQQEYPMLITKDIRFCCLVKIGVNLQDLSDIYCVSKAAITKRKFRIKTEKLGVSDEAKSLDDCLRDF